MFLRRFVLVIPALVALALMVPAMAWPPESTDGESSGSSPIDSPTAADLGLKVAPGFKVTLYSDQDIANDIYAMTLDRKGRVVVTSAGWVKMLHDTRNAGKADKATLFAETKSGGMGLCFDGNDLLFCGDGWMSRYRDPDGKGQAQGAPEKIIPLRFGEHGGHAMRKGPDGWWYVIAGNDAEIDKRHLTLPTSPVKQSEAGGILRMTPDLKGCELFACGFRNPYDFDFNPAGDIFTYDSDTERDYFLPWYSPTRAYHVAQGGHHGWRLEGYMRSWCRRDYFVDTPEILAPIGRGSPTGVVCYRHDHFPEKYRGSVFICDWTFGKVWFLPLIPKGAGYTTKAEVFLESTGTNGFAPTDIAVAPDGSMFLSIGGRKTRGSVFKIEYVGDGKTPVERRPEPKNDLERVLYAHQPLDAWSRAQWEPLARKLGPEPFLMAIRDENLDTAARVRAVEVLTEIFSGIPENEIDALTRAIKPRAVLARMAWSIGRTRITEPGRRMLLQMLGIDDPVIQRSALEAAAHHVTHLDGEGLTSTLDFAFRSNNKRVRLAAARLGAALPAESWKRLESSLPRRSPRQQLGILLALAWRQTDLAGSEAIIEGALAALKDPSDADLTREALRLIVLALGDWHMRNPPSDSYTGYSVKDSLKGREATVQRIRKGVRPLFPSRDELVNIEATRLLAMMEDDDPALIDRVGTLLTKDSSPTLDMHYLVVLSRLKGQRGEKVTATVADTLLSLDRKLEGQQQRDKQNWSVRLVEVLTQLMAKDPRLADAILTHADLVKPAHVALTACLNAEQRKQAAGRFLTAVKKDPDFAFSGALIDLLKLLPPEEVRPVLRGRWNEFGLRDAIVLQLAEQPDAADRERFLTGLQSHQPGVLRASLAALEKLPRDETAKNLVPVLSLLRRLQSEPKEAALRAQALALANRQAGHAFAVKEDKTDAPALRQAYRPVFDWFAKEQPILARAVNGTDEEDEETWKKFLARVDWAKGDAPRGEVIYRNRACVTCHAGATRLGPDLQGIASRFSRDDLFAAIIWPSRDVAPAYRMEVFETKEGQLHTGLVVFGSADGVILQTGATTTLRIATTDIASRQPSSRSLMPNGLLKDLKPEEVADLYAFLQTLKAPAK